MTTPLLYDSRRPWPLGLPSREDAVLAIIGQREVTPQLEGAHLRTLTLFPEYLFDEARTALGDALSPAGRACGSAWRVLLAAERIEGAMGVDVPALLALVDEAVEARDVLKGVTAFALDGGLSGEELLTALDACIGRFVVLARSQQGTARRTVLGPMSRLLSIESVDTRFVFRRLLPTVAMVSVVAAALFHLVGGAQPRAVDDWVVVGDVGSGHALLVPASEHASEEALFRRVEELKASGIEVRRARDGQLLLSRAEERR